MGFYPIPVDIALAGKFCSGKDTVADAYLDYNQYKKPDNYYKKFAFAGLLKDEYCAELGISRTELELNKAVHRSHLQSYGSTRRITQGENYWIDKAVEKRQQWTGKAIFTDVRFPNEAEYFYGPAPEYSKFVEGKVDPVYTAKAYLVRLNVPDAVRFERYKKLYGQYPTDEQINHPSETSVNELIVHLDIDGQQPTELILREIYFKYQEALTRYNIRLKPAYQYLEEKQ